MGMDRVVSFAGRTPPTWADVAEVLAQKGCPVQMRMIDGELSFPEEQPPEGWREIRVGTPAAMVTVRRQGEQVSLITWGDADLGQRQLWNALAWAWAVAGQGVVQTPEGPMDAAAFATTAELPETLRP
jgi:hypothetical protein